MAFVDVEMNLEIYKLLKSSWLSKQPLASEEGLCTTVLLLYALLLGSLHISVPHFVSSADFMAFSPQLCSAMYCSISFSPSLSSFLCLL